MAASWLPASAWEDPTIRPYVPSRFAVCASQPTPQPDDYGSLRIDRNRVFSALPARAADLLRGSAEPSTWGWGHRMLCFDLTTDEARALAGSLEAAGIRPDATDTNYYWIEDVLLDFSPYMPDGEPDCGCGG